MTLLAPGAAKSADDPVTLPRHDYYVSKGGSDLNKGTFERPFKTVQKGVDALHAGDRLTIHGGVYSKPVEIDRKHDIVIRSYRDERAHIVGSLSRFLKRNSSAWVKATGPRAVANEYVSSAAVNRAAVNRGSFLSRKPYTRLITYGRLEDLRATNQTFRRLRLNNPLPGPVVRDDDGRPRPYSDELPVPFKYPWVYMGPGLWFDKGEHLVHIRLSGTSNHVPGLADYDGPTNPNKVRLAIADKARVALLVRRSQRVRFERLTIGGGGDLTMRLHKVEDLDFDHVRVEAAPNGVRTSEATHTVFRDSEFNGGLPPWYFRSDRKLQYRFRDKRGEVRTNNLGEQTIDVLLEGAASDVRTRIFRSEFADAHDVYLAGRDVIFRRNWIDNLNDEALLADGNPSWNLRVFQNVVTRSLSGISFGADDVGGRHFFYRNLVDLRAPTAGRRPRVPGDTKVWRYGQLFKSNRPDGPWDLFQNTFLVARQPRPASFLHFANDKDPYTHRAFNNIFVAVNPNARSDQPITFVSPPASSDVADGNDYHRIGHATPPAFKWYLFPRKRRFREFDSLAELQASDLVDDSRSRYAPGFETSSTDADPQFVSIRPDGEYRASDDLRPTSTRLQGKGVDLPGGLPRDPLGPAQGQHPDIGVYRVCGGPLRVGVENRRTFPDD